MGASQAKTQAIQQKLTELKEKDLALTDYEAWNQLFSVLSPLSFDEIFTYIPPVDVKAIRETKPLNLAHFVTHCVMKIENAQTDVTPKAQTEARCAARILSRIIPFLHADRADQFEERLFWSIIPFNVPEQGDTPKLSEIVSDIEQTLLGERLIKAVMKLLFFPLNSKVPPPPAEDASVPLELCWKEGVGVDKVTNLGDWNEQYRRTDYVKLLLACFSEILFLPPAEAPAFTDKFIEVASRSSPQALPLFYSLINVALTYDPIGWGVPYNHMLVADVYEPLATTSLHLLLLLLDHNRAGVENVYIKAIAEIKRPEEYKFIYSSLSKLLNNSINAHHTYLPNSTKAVSCHQELLMLFMKLLQLNPGFLSYIVRNEDVAQVLIPILTFVHQGRKDPAQLGLVHLGTFILLLLSSEREFSVALNKPLTQKLLMDLPTFTGCLADALVLVIHKLMVDSQTKLDALYECLLTILTNISPYIKSLSMTSSMKLVKLFATLAKPSFVFAGERNHRYLFFLLETFNNIIQYQFQGNNRLVYCILTNRDTFIALANLAVPEPSPAVTLTQESTSAPITPSTSATAVSATPTPQASTTGPTTTTEAAAPADATASRTSIEKSAAPAAPAQPKYVPTNEWLQEWKAQLPLETIIRLLNAISPQVSSLASGNPDETQILDFLAKTTLVGLLPVPHKIVIRQYQPNPATNLWYTTYLWGVLFLNNKQPPLFSNLKEYIRLYVVKM